MPQKYCIISPDTDPESTTFIKVLRDNLEGDKDYLYDGLIPSRSLQNGYLRKPSVWDRLYLRIKKTNKAEYFFDKYLKNEGVELVFAQYGPTGASVVDSCKKNNVKLVVHFHGFDVYEREILNCFKDGYNKIFEYASQIIAVSLDMVEALVKMGASREKITYTPCAPKNDFFQIKPNMRSNQFLFVGRFVDKKAPHLLILAFKQVVDRIANAQLTMIGDGPLLGACKKLAEYLKIDSNIRFRGATTHQDVLNAYAESFCYVQHSITAENGDAEGTPVAILEANAAGLPVVATRHKGIMDTQIEGETAWLVDELNVEGMASKMIELYNNREKAEVMGSQGNKRVARHYNQDKHLMEIELALSINSF